MSAVDPFTAHIERFYDCPCDGLGKPLSIGRLPSRIVITGLEMT
jgi:hypothetical protein